MTAASLDTHVLDTVPAAIPRVVAGLTTLVLLAALAGAGPLALLLVLPDFVARAFDRRERSYLSAIGRHLLPRLPVGVRAARAVWAPKRFAARVGLLVLAAALVAAALGAFETAGVVLLGTMALLSALEAGAGLCVACRLYTLLGRLGVVHACPDGRCELPTSRG